jgi:transcriptional regulator with XRE-family HTH domain
MNGQDIRNFRKINNLSQSELARRIGCHLRTIIRWEKGVFNPHRKLRRKVERIYYNMNDCPTCGGTGLV